MTDGPANDKNDGKNIFILADHFERGAFLNFQILESELSFEPFIESSIELFIELFIKTDLFSINNT